MEEHAQQRPGACGAGPARILQFPAQSPRRATSPQGSSAVTSTSTRKPGSISRRTSTQEVAGRRSLS